MLVHVIAFPINTFFSVFIDIEKVFYALPICIPFIFAIDTFLTILSLSMAAPASTPAALLQKSTLALAFGGLEAFMLRLTSSSLDGTDEERATHALIFLIPIAATVFGIVTSYLHERVQRTHFLTLMRLSEELQVRPRDACMHAAHVSSRRASRRSCRRRSRPPTR